MGSSYLAKQNSWVPIEKCGTEISIKKRWASPSIKGTQFPLPIAWASTLHKVQGLNLEQGVIDFDLRKQKSFGPGQMYTGLSRLKTYDNLYCTREFKKSAIKVNKDALLEYGRLQQNDLFSTVKKCLGDKVTVLVHNARSLPRDVDNILSDNGIINNNIIWFTETQINQSDSTYKIRETSSLFNINFNNKEKNMSLAYESRNDVAVLNKIDANGVSVLTFKKNAFSNRVFTLMLVYRKQSMHMNAIFTSNTFYRYYIRGLELWSFISVTKSIFRYFHTPCPDGK